MIKGIFFLMLLVLLHEFGHFIAAKLSGVAVNEFSIGFGPAIFKHQGKETLFSIRLFLFGGYCAMEGENGNSDSGFYKIPSWKRIFVLASGPAMNLIVGFIFILMIILMTSVSVFALPSNANTTGLIRPTDQIVQIDDFHIFTANDIAYAEAFNPNGPYTVVIERDGEEITLENYTPVGSSLLYDGSLKIVENNLWSKIEFAIRNCASMLQNVMLSLKHLILGDFGISDMSGPIGIASSFKGANISGTLTLIAFISINLGILNLLPIPALDGGQIVIALLEKLFRRKFNEKVVAGLNFVFLAGLLVLIAVVTIGDIAKLL